MAQEKQRNTDTKKTHANLVIVESPAKAKTIEKFLGKEYTVMSSYGHIRDLSKKELGIDLKKDFAPDYEISPDKKKLVESLAKSAKEAERVWLASDEDREGEAIAWHLTQVLGLPVDQTRRIVFHEITKNAIMAAIENPRTIDMNLVNAQQARRVLDRLVGFELSPVLWKKVKPSLSAGRVQSVAVRRIVEREREIMAFCSTPYYRTVLPHGRPRQDPLQGGARPAFRFGRGGGRIPAGVPRHRFPRTQQRKQTRRTESRRTVHHLHAPAGGGPQTRHVGFADDVDRTAPLRKRLHHLHAYRLPEPLLASHRCRP